MTCVRPSAAPPSEHCVSPHACRWLLLCLVLIKLAITACNSFAYDRGQYDAEHHAWRARSGGLEVGQMAYNPPLYYLPASPVALGQQTESESGTAQDAELLRVLRFTNIGYLALFYGVWVFGIFPRILPPASALLASLGLLVVPGYQKLAVMAHPDNAFAAIAGAAFLLWLSSHRRASGASGQPGTGLNLRSLMPTAVAIGLCGLTRPFAVVPVAVLSAALVLTIWRGGGAALPMKRVGRIAATLLVIGSLSMSWYAYRYFESGETTDAYDETYIAKYRTLRDDFDFVAYFTSFHFTDLLREPNRGYGRLAQGPGQVPDHRNTHDNSFFTLAYSELWGDHWLYFSGAGEVDGKVWPKRVLLLLALPATLCGLLALLLKAMTAPAHIARLWRRPELRWDALPIAVAVVTLLLGSALFLYWQTGPALLPGKNSTMKFIYNAWLVPFALSVACLHPPGPRVARLLTIYLLGLFAVSLPVALYWSSMPSSGP